MNEVISTLRNYGLEFLFHRSAIGLVSGAIVGMYTRGIFFEYRVVWKSTFIHSSELIAILLNAVLGPAAFLLYGRLLTVEDVKPLLLEHGISAAPWIHRFAVSAFLFVIIPRSYLMFRSRRSASSERSWLRGRVFKLKPHERTLRGYLVLDLEEARLLFSIDHYLTHRDINNQSNEVEKAKAQKWLKAWTESLEQANNFRIVTDEKILFRGIDEITENKLSQEKRSIILFESFLFSPYYNIEAEEVRDINIKPDRKLLEKGVFEVSMKLNCNYHILVEAKAVYDKALKEIPPSKYWKVVTVAVTSAILLAVTAGYAAPLIGHLIGSALIGFHGAAATTAGLALLGGGALAAGGFGMAGGTLLIIGGGAALGIGTGYTMVNLFEKSPDLTLRELAKLEAVLKVLLRHLDNSKVLIANAISFQRYQLEGLISRFDNLRLGNEPISGDNLKQIQQSITLFERAIERLKDYHDTHY